MSADDVQVHDNADQSRYEITVGGTPAGFTRYVLHGQQADFVHTEIDGKFEGHGLASTLIRSALDDARRRGWQVLPYCQFVKAFIAKRDEYRDLVPADRRAQFGLEG
jgi:hypothetical protein